MKTSNYYQNELDKITTNGDYCPLFKFSNDKITTKWMNLNKESAEILILWLGRKLREGEIKD